MASPSFSGITPVSYDGDADWVIPATAVGLTPPGGKDTRASAFGNSARFIGGNSSNLLTAGTDVTLNLESVRAIYGLVGVSTPNELSDEASGGLSAGISDSNNNWKIFTVGGVDTVQSFRSFIIQAGQAPTSSAGAIDESDISQIIAGYRGTVTGIRLTRPTVLFDQVGIVDDPVLSGGEVGDVASFDALTSLLSSTNLAAIEVVDGSKVFKLQIPLEISAEVFEDSLGMLLFEDAGHFYIDNDYYYLRFNRPTDTATFILSDRKIAATLGLAIEVSAGCDTTLPIALNNINIEAPGQTTVETPMVWDGGSESNRTLVRYVSGSVLNARLLVNSDLQVDCSPGQNLSALSYRLNGSSQLVLNPNSAGASAINLSGLSSAASITIDNLTANNITIAVSSGLSYTLASPTAGGGSITVQAPQQQTIISGVPTTNNANGVAPEPAIAFYNDSSGTFLAALDTSDPEYSAGSFTVALTDYLASGNIRIEGEAKGWRRTPPTVLDVASPPGALSLAAGFTEFLDETGNSIIGNGTVAGKDRLTYDQPNTRFEIAPGGLDFDSAVDKFDELTSGKTGLQNFNSAVVRGINFISNKYGREVLLPAPLTAAATEDAATSPSLTDFLALRAGDPLVDIFEHGLSSTASGLTSRPEVLRISTRFISGSESGALTPGQEAILTNLDTRSARVDNLIEDSSGDRFTAKALETAPSGGGSGSSAAEIYNYFNTNPRQDPFKADLSALPTTTQFEARTLPSTSYLTSANYGAIATAVWNATTRELSNITASQVSAIATGVEAAIINEGDGQQVIDAILQVFNNNLDLPPLELQAIAQAVRTELTTELGRIDANVSSRLADSDYTAPLDSNATQTAVQSALTTQGYTSARATFLNKLNVIGDLANTNNASLFQASGFSTHSASDVWAVAIRTLTAIDKTGYSLTPTERSNIALAVEAAIINEGDGQQVVDAILQVFNSNLDLPPLELQAIAQAVRSELTTELGRIDVAVSTAVTDLSLVALETTAQAVLTRVNLLPTLVNMEASSQLTAIADLSGVNSSLATIQTALNSVAADAKAAKNLSAAGL